MSGTEQQFALNGLQEQPVAVSHSRVAVVGNQQGLGVGGPPLGGVQDQGGALAVAQLQALTLDENQAQMRQHGGSSVKPREVSAGQASCDPTRSPLSWAEALGQLDGGGWEGAGTEASILFQELATFQ